MDKFIINGGTPLRGEVQISGAKNAAVAIIPAAILAADKCILDNVPSISDVNVALEILADMGASIRRLNKSKIEIDTSCILDGKVSHDLARSTRGSSYFLGALLGRFKRAQVPLPGGCDLGSRPIDQHIKCFEALGAKSDIQHGIVDIKADKLIGTQIYFDKVTVGGTINALLASAQAEGLTIIENAAKEPHIVDLANFLNTMGADIMGAGTDVIKVRGVQRLHGAEYSVIPDQIEAGTFMVAAAATGGDVLLTNVIPKHLEPITAKLRKMGVTVEIAEATDNVRVIGKPRYDATDIKTAPHPGFPTDMQPQMTTLLTIATGTSMVTESIFDTRFKYVDELRRMGADITVDSRVAVVKGVENLTGAPVKACDLRAGAALIIAGLAAKGVTEIEDIYHIERGYENMEIKLRNLGADIVKSQFDDEKLRKAL
ncbi:MAG: UDP-N-acetylglucosamine 1-carboxyvinyltransferase [Ruminococcaceae bacterium]|nr:UDP-N-acetylglucosamine 1-carboxyvinyltransferase [Oscillospiraceae bacterium]